MVTFSAYSVISACRGVLRDFFIRRLKGAAPESLCRARRRGPAEQIEYRPDHTVELSRFGDAEIGARTDSRRNFIWSVTRDDNNRNLTQGAIAAEFSEHLLAVNVRQVQIENYDVGQETARRTIARDTSGRRDNFAAFGVEEMLDRFTRVFIILNDQDAGLLFLHRSSDSSTCPSLFRLFDAT